MYFTAPGNASQVKVTRPFADSSVPSVGASRRKQAWVAEGAAVGVSVGAGLAVAVRNGVWVAVAVGLGERVAVAGGQVGVSVSVGLG